MASGANNNPQTQQVHNPAQAQQDQLNEDGDGEDEDENDENNIDEEDEEGEEEDEGEDSEARLAMHVRYPVEWMKQQRWRSLVIIGSLARIWCLYRLAS